MFKNISFSYYFLLEIYFPYFHCIFLLLLLFDFQSFTIPVRSSLFSRPPTMVGINALQAAVLLPVAALYAFVQKFFRCASRSGLLFFFVATELLLARAPPPSPPPIKWGGAGLVEIPMSPPPPGPNPCGAVRVPFRKSPRKALAPGAPAPRERRQVPRPRRRWDHPVPAWEGGGQGFSWGSPEGRIPEEGERVQSRPASAGQKKG